tara:strand:- start:924 stop:1142 length:219 start_codon:yes stop_codon:yes gene_type:complete
MNKENLVEKLNFISQNISDNKYDDNILQIISQFVINIDFLNEMDSNNDEFSKKDFLKFLSLGWYFYTQLPIN